MSISTVGNHSPFYPQDLSSSSQISKILEEPKNESQETQPSSYETAKKLAEFLDFEKFTSDLKITLKNFWLTQKNNPEETYFKIIEYFENDLSNLALDLLNSRAVELLPLLSDDRKPSIYYLLLNAIKHDQYAFVNNLARFFLTSEEGKKFISETLESDNQQSKFILFICSMALGKNQTLSILLKSEKFIKEEIDIDDLILCIKYFSKHCKNISIILEPQILKLISKEDFETIVLINIFYSHTDSISHMLNSSYIITTDMICNCYYYALKMKRDELLIEFIDQFELIEKEMSDLNNFLIKANQEQFEEKFSQALQNRCTWVIYELLAFSNFKLSAKILGSALVKIASSPNCKFSLDYTIYFFNQIINFTQFTKIANGKNGWGEALVTASKNGHIEFVKIILKRQKTSKLPFDNNTLEQADFEARKNNHHKTASLLQKFIEDTITDSENQSSELPAIEQ